MQGNSLKTLLTHPKKVNPDGGSFVISSVSDYPISEKVHYTIRDNRWRYILTAYDEEELYDHDKDQHEWNNLAYDTKHERVKNELKEKLLSQIGDQSNFLPE